MIINLLTICMISFSGKSVLCPTAESGPKIEGSLVDSVWQQAISFDNFIELFPNLIVISHRLSTILQCTEIYVLGGGEFIASGTHSQLMESCAEYREIVKEQLIANDTK